MLSDDIVIERVRSGDTSAYEVLVRRYNRKILGFIFRMVKDTDDAESLAQDVFVKVFEKLNNYKAEDNFQAYIYRVAKNMTLNHIKKNSRSKPFSWLMKKDEASRTLASEGEQEKIIIDENRDEWINRNLKELPENQRLALIMKVYMNLSYIQIQEITGWSVPKIETLISRGRTRLKNKYKMQEKMSGNVL